MKRLGLFAVCVCLVWPSISTRVQGRTQMQVQAASPERQAPPQVRDVGKPVPPPTGKGRISGTVKDQAGQPVRRATIAISGDMRLDRMTTTDEEGKFGFSDLPVGRFSVTASKAGYPQVSYGAKQPYRPGSGVFLSEGEQATGLALTLARGAAMSGIVYDEDGAPMPGVPVMAWEVRTALNGERTLDSAGDTPVTVVTDDQGAYRVYGLAPGTYTVGTSWYFHGDPLEARVVTEAQVRSAFQPALPQLLTAAPPPDPPESPRSNYSPVFSPGVTDPLSADVFALKAGEVRTGVDLRMQYLATSRIEGTIVDPRGTPIAVELSLSRVSAVSALNTTQVRPGQSASKFTFESLSPGEYAVVAKSREATAGDVMWAIAEVTLVPGGTTEVTLSMQPAATVSGQLIFEGTGLPVPPDLTRVSVRLADVGPGRRNNVSAKTDASGSITATGVVPGQFTVRASVPGFPPTGPGWTMRSVTVGGRDVTDLGFDISGGGAQGVKVTFTSLVSELSGTVTTASGAPESDYFVIAMPADRAYWLPGSRRIVSTRPDANGRYAFRGLPAGEYRIAVTTDLVPRDLQEVSTLEQLAAVSVPTTLALGERKTVHIKTSGQ